MDVDNLVRIRAHKTRLQYLHIAGEHKEIYFAREELEHMHLILLAMFFPDRKVVARDMVALCNGLQVWMIAENTGNFHCQLTAVPTPEEYRARSTFSTRTDGNMEVCIHLHSSPARVNISVKTIQKWDRLGFLPASRTITNPRYYTDEDLSAALRIPRVPSVRRTASLLPRLKSGPKTGFSQSKKNP